MGEKQSFVVPVKLLGVFYIESTEEDVRKEAGNIAQKVADSQKVKEILFEASVKISEEIKSQFLFVPGVILPETEDSHAEIAMQFGKDYVKRCSAHLTSEEQGDGGEEQKH